MGVTEKEKDRGKDRKGELNIQRRGRQNKVEGDRIHMVYSKKHKNAWKRHVQVGHNVDGTVKKEKGKKR